MVAAWLGTKAIAATHHFKDFGLLGRVVNIRDESMNMTLTFSMS